MKEEIKDKWIAALESGEYSQTIHCLKNEEGFCCLGVLADLYLKEGSTSAAWNEDIKQYNGKFAFITSDDRRELALLPDEVMEWSGIRTDIAEYSGGIAYGSLANANDSGENFERIVEIIKETWKEL